VPNPELMDDDKQRRMYIQDVHRFGSPAILIANILGAPCKMDPSDNRNGVSAMSN